MSDDPGTAPPGDERVPDVAGAAVRLLGRSGAVGTMLVTGPSMEPTFRAGQQLRVEFGAVPPRRGDVLLFGQGDGFAVHRVLGTARLAGGRFLRTRGDGAERLDGPLDPARVAGRVIAAGGPEGWRDLRGRPARAYALGLALHSLAWAALAALGERGARGLGVSRERAAALRRSVTRADRRLLRVWHGLLFRVCHPRSATPPDAGAQA